VTVIYFNCYHPIAYIPIDDESVYFCPTYLFIHFNTTTCFGPLIGPFISLANKNF